MTGYTLEERLIVRSSGTEWLNLRAFSGHQGHTVFLMRFLNKSAAGDASILVLQKWLAASDHVQILKKIDVMYVV